LNWPAETAARISDRFFKEKEQSATALLKQIAQWLAYEILSYNCAV